MKINPASLAVLALACPLSAFAETKPKPMKVFVFAGQSNMTGMARPHTLEHIKMSPETAKEYADVFDKDGKPVTLDAVYVSQWMDKRSGRRHRSDLSAHQSEGGAQGKSLSKKAT